MSEEKKTSFKVKEEVSSYRNDNAWEDDITESFPRNVVCPICQNGKFELSFQGAVVNGVCSNCKTSVLYQFYDTRYLYLDHLADSVNYTYLALRKFLLQEIGDAETKDDLSHDFVEKLRNYL